MSRNSFFLTSICLLPLIVPAFPLDHCHLPQSPTGMRRCLGQQFHTVLVGLLIRSLLTPGQGRHMVQARPA